MSLVSLKPLLASPKTLLKHVCLSAVVVSTVVITGCASKPQIHNAARYAKAPDFYTIRSGDTLSGVATRYGLDYQSIADMNDIVAPYRIYVGQSIRLKKSNARASTQAMTQVAPIQRQTVTVPAQQTVTVTRTPITTSPVTTTPTTIAPAVKTPVQSTVTAPVVATTPSVASSSLRWVKPSNGPVLQSFNLASNVKGTRYGGNVGDPIVAAANGQVVYAADGLKEYGNLVLVKHIDGYITAYAHNSKLVVKSGQNVTAGQKIAEMGSSGASRTMLEFQVRLNGKPVNPSTVVGNP